MFKCPPKIRLGFNVGSQVILAWFAFWKKQRCFRFLFSLRFQLKVFSLRLLFVFTLCGVRVHSRMCKLIVFGRFACRGGISSFSQFVFKEANRENVDIVRCSGQVFSWILACGNSARWNEHGARFTVGSSRPSPALTGTPLARSARLRRGPLFLAWTWLRGCSPGDLCLLGLGLFVCLQSFELAKLLVSVIQPL